MSDDKFILIKAISNVIKSGMNILGVETSVLRTKTPIVELLLKKEEEGLTLVT